MNTYVIHHVGPRAPKGLSMNDRAHWRTKNRSTQDVRRHVSREAVVQQIPKCGHLTVELVWIVGDRRERDDDNLAPFAKAIYDGLASNKGISAQLVPDDTPQFITKKAPRIEYRQGEKPARFEIHITTEGAPHHG